jgi:hypothetical protein
VEEKEMLLIVLLEMTWLMARLVIHEVILVKEIVAVILESQV